MTLALIRFAVLALGLAVPVASPVVAPSMLDTSGRQTGATAEIYKAPEDGGPRHFEVVRGVNLREDASTSAPVVTRYAPATILVNLGCRQAEGRVWCDVQQFGGGPRGFVAAEFIKPAVGPDGGVAMGPDDSAYRAGQGQFDATGKIPCAQASGQPMTQCEFGVARAGGGDATVVITRPDGRKRAIYFSRGVAIGADTSEADRSGDFRVTKESDLNMVRVGTERYEIPDAVVLGG